MKPNPLELAWAAGFFDGEGHVSASVQSGKRACTMRIQIAQTDPEVLRRFQRAVGLGNVHGPHNYGKRDVWAYRTNRFEHVQAIVAMLWPFLSGPKRADAAQALTAMAAWRAEKAATCRKGLHLLAEVGLSGVGSCGECYRVSQRRRWKGGLPPGERTHCPAGHAYEGGNLYIVPGTGVRHCRACTRENARRYRAARDTQETAKQKLGLMP